MDCFGEKIESKRLRKPDWLRVRIGGGANYAKMEKIVRERHLHTVCSEALCPNAGECWEHGRATLMILGGTCTRGCRFCNVAFAAKADVDAGEPARVADAVKAMGLRDVVITSVTRDDLIDGGAGIWAETIRRVHEAVPGIVIEALVPDFAGSQEALAEVLASKPAILGHNLETVPSLYWQVRARADYQISLDLLAAAHKAGLITKTAVMVGLGETSKEVAVVMRDAVKAGVDIFYIGQYLQPTKKHFPVYRYVEPAEFEKYKKTGLKAGLKVVVSGPLVRSSYHSEEQDEFVRGQIGK